MGQCVGQCCSGDGGEAWFPPQEAWAYNEADGQTANIQITPTIALDLARCRTAAREVLRKPTREVLQTGGYDMRKLDDLHKRIGNLEKEAGSNKPTEMKESEDAEEMPTDSLLEQTSDNLDEAGEARDNHGELALQLDTKDTPEDAQDVVDKGCSLSSIFSCFGSSTEPVEFDDEPASSPAPAQPASSGWGFAAIGGSSKPKAPSMDAQAPYGAGKNGVDKLCAVAAKRMTDGLDVRHDVKKFISAQKLNMQQVAEELEKNGCPENLVQKFIEEHIDGDTLRYMQVEDIMRVCDLHVFKARGLYAKIWRILGITIVGETLRIEAVDSKPTGASLVKIVQKRMYDEGRSDETSRYVAEKMEIMEEKKDTSTIKQGEVSTATSVQTTSDRPAYPEGKSVEGSVQHTGMMSNPTMGQLTQQQQFQMYQYQLQQQQLSRMNTSIQPDTAGKDGLHNKTDC